eukprot:TRINITY_DN30973_c0_g1_i1.p1 TRINITY_DN30973_c0_g1~~TRINITY_DN30973_c0_g1_i1.p1  ORF type:complete len:659 (-),score=125.32 TRINITY_DN30973_c0_g1_i1:18-1994(-)
MVSAAERRLAAKQKLAALASQRKTEKKSDPPDEVQTPTAAKPVTESAGSASLASDSVKKKIVKKPEAAAKSAKSVAKGERRKLQKPDGLKRRKKEAIPLVPTSMPQPLGADAYRKEHNIICQNMECPAPLETFEAAEAAMGSHFVQMLKDRGYLAPAPIQAQAWPLALQGKDVVAIAQTGSGKTLAYLLPALVRLRERNAPSTDGEPAKPRVLVLGPTRELIQQIATDVAKLAISINHRFVPCFGGVWKNAQVKQLAKGCDILLSTPGRLKDFMLGNKAEGLAPAVDVSNVSYLVLDEADAMLAMGFMPQIREILARCLPTGKPEQGGCAEGPGAGTARQTLFFTATWPRKVRAAVKEVASTEAAQLRIGQGVGSDKLTANKNVRQIVQMVEYWEKSARLTNVLTSELKAGETCLVFCGTKGRTEYVVSELNKASVVDWCEGIHSGKEQWVRDKSLEKFRQHTANGNCRAVLVATDVAARGLDIPGVPLVVVYDLNGWNGELNIDSYVHRIGRTGRAGNVGRAFTFVESKDRGLPDLVKLLKDADQRIPVPLQDMEVNQRLPLGTKKGGAGKAADKDSDDDADGSEEDEEMDEGGKKRNKKAKGKSTGKGTGKDKGKSKGKGKGKSKGDGKGKDKAKGKIGKAKGKGKGERKEKDIDD